MAGAIDLGDESKRGVPHYRVINPASDIAYRDKAGRLRAGPDNPLGYNKGDMVRKEDYPNMFRSLNNRKHTNLVKALMRSQELTEKEAREQTNELLDELEQAETKEERADIWQKYGSP